LEDYERSKEQNRQREEYLKDHPPTGPFTSKEHDMRYRKR
jgi:hypothetical protein